MHTGIYIWFRNQRTRKQHDEYNQLLQLVEDYSQDHTEGN